jgi:hypothetical protein
MKSRLVSLVLLAISPLLSTSQSINGTWSLAMDINPDGIITGEGKDDPHSYCKLILSMGSDDSFTGKFVGCQEDRIVTGYFYNNKLVNLIVYSTNPNKRNYYIFSGAMMENGSLKGFYYTEGCLNGDFEATKLSDSPVANSNFTTYEQPDNEETRHSYYEFDSPAAKPTTQL